MSSLACNLKRVAFARQQHQILTLGQLKVGKFKFLHKFFKFERLPETSLNVKLPHFSSFGYVKSMALVLHFFWAKENRSSTPFFAWAASALMAVALLAAPGTKLVGDVVMEEVMSSAEISKYGGYSYVFFPKINSFRISFSP